jgi:hypothetical protein
MIIPRAFLSPDGKVILGGKDGIDTVTVQTGIVSTEWAEIIAGLKTTDVILKIY